MLLRLFNHKSGSDVIAKTEACLRDVKGFLIWQQLILLLITMLDDINDN